MTIYFILGNHDYYFGSVSNVGEKILQQTLLDAIHVNTKKVIIATHVPPFPECSWHKDHPSDYPYLKNIRDSRIANN